MNKFEELNLSSVEETEELLPQSFISRLKTSLREKINPGEDPEQADQVRELINMRTEYLQKTYPDWRKYQTYYILSGQPIPRNVSRVDFPEEDSIIKFIESF